MEGHGGLEGVITRVADNLTIENMSEPQQKTVLNVLLPVLRRERRERGQVLGGSIVFLWCTAGQSLVRNVSQYVRITSGGWRVTTLTSYRVI